MTGPMPPNVGGMTTVLCDLGNSKLAEQVNLVFLNTAKTTREGRSLIEAVLSKLALWLDWIKLIKTRPETIAHIHTCSGFTFFLDSVLVCLAKLCRVPVVLHVHGAKFDQFIDRLNPALVGLARWICRHCEYVIVLSESWKIELSKRMGPQRFAVVENGVPIKATLSRNAHDVNLVNILFLGNLTERKGVLDLLAVMPEVRHAVLHLVGGEEQPGIIDSIMCMLQDPKLNGKVKYHGVKYGQDKQQFLQDADIFVLPSYAEGLPISLLEAMACGIPVIVSGVGGIPAVVTHEQEGFLITAGNRGELSMALNKLINSPQLRERMGLAARKRCQEQFSIDVTADKLLSLYREIFPAFH